MFSSVTLYFSGLLVMMSCPETMIIISCVGDTLLNAADFLVKMYIHTFVEFLLEYKSIFFINVICCNFVFYFVENQFSAVFLTWQIIYY